MKVLYGTLLLCFFFISCKKPTDVIAPPPTLADTAMGIASIDLVEVNEFDVHLKINPPEGERFDEAYLQWSTSDSFTKDEDSLLLGSIISRVETTTSLKHLKQATTYFCRLKV